MLSRLSQFCIISKIGGLACHLQESPRLKLGRQMPITPWSIKKEITMSVSGISTTNLFNYTSQSSQSQMQQLAQSFQQLGSDLQSGNLSAAQAEFATLQQTGTASSTSSAQNNNPVAQLFNQLSQDLKSGNLSAAQQEYASIQRDFQNQKPHVHHHHYHGARNGGEITQLFQQLGQDLQSGNLSAAQQAYATLSQDFSQVSQNSGGSSTNHSTESGLGVSVVA
jgi:outer membrane protein assembly factor BamD (BamD/ComL family)